MDILDRIQQDYQRFPSDQSYDLYAEEVYFEDPLNRFHGVERYRKMIRFIEKWFIAPHLDLHSIERTESPSRAGSPDQIITRWTLSWTAPFLWKPRMVIKGWSELQLNDDNLIISHIDYWECSRLDVVKQLFFRID
ncbi:MAG: DUF2358 domain-containing protein [Leptolyngbyaceae cyanobacterium MO_188.B28]|nr:DUF2358 domain-containing protein [Leptolyngbyaceae cyanobacterium MO_188.B28]